MDAETLAKQPAELERQRQAAADALEAAKQAAAAMETTQPPFWATEGQ